MQRSIDLAAVRARFEGNFTFRGELGASVSIWQEGREVISLAAGWRDRQQSTPWRADTLVLLWSITKGLAASCLLHALATDAIGLETPVAALWPEFGQSGKERVTLAQLLSHQAGLAAMVVPDVSLFDHDAVASALAAQPPSWPPGQAHGYHPRTFGFLMEECLRRLRPGHTLGRYWRECFGDPLNLDIWIGLPDELNVRVASVYPARSGPGQHGTLDPFYEALAVEESLTRRAFAGPRGLHSVASMNTPEARRASLPSLGGIGTATSLGKFYALLANGGVLEGRTFFPSEAIAWMSTPLTNGPDEVLCRETAFSAGFMQDPLGPDGRKLRHLFGPSTRAFGQPGAGGGHAFADPEHNIAFAYLMNQMELGVLPNEKSLSLVAAIYGEPGEEAPTPSAVC
jgi:CubicO group peptidase (beta-lactamase class C family)